MTLRILAGFVMAALIALVARRMRSLSPSGAIAAAAIGTAAIAAGWVWGFVLVAYFVASSALSRVGRGIKESRTASIVEKGGERDAVQVLANGVVFAIAAAGMVASPGERWLALGAGSLAASAADTWATEIGTLYGRRPRSIRTFRPVATGTSGGISLAGTLASFAGAAFVSSLASADRRNSFWAVVIGGIGGAVIDSVLGATLQSQRWCDACARQTERQLHDCGNRSRPHRGLSWLDNDAVNFVSSLAGGLLAAVLSG